MRSKHRAFVLPVLAALFLAAISARTFAEETIVVNTRSLDPEAPPGLLVRVFAEGREFTGGLDAASVYLDRRLAGPAPYRADLDPGSILVGVSAPGFAPKELRLELERGRAYELRFSLEREEGGLLVRVEPPDALLSVDGRPARPGRLSLPSGYHGLLLRRFGFRDLSTSVYVPARGLARAELRLEPAPFAVSRLRASPERFNPAAGGPLGSSRIGFLVSGPGSARLGIYDETGEEVFSRVFPSFEGWEQGLVWDGRDASGRPLPDGDYELRLDASSPDGMSEELELRLGIDSRLLALPFGATGGLSGLRYLPLPLPAPPGLGLFELGLGSDPGTGSAELEAAFRSSTQGLGLGFAARSLLGGSGLLEVGLELPLGGESWPGPGFGLALGLGASSEGSFRGELDLGLPLLSGLGGAGPSSRTRPFLALGPGLAAAGSSSGGELLARLGLGAGLASETWILGLSARATSADLLGGTLGLGSLEGAAELRFLLPRSPLLLGLGLGGSLDADLAPGPPWGELRLGLRL